MEFVGRIIHEKLPEVFPMLMSVFATLCVVAADPVEVVLKSHDDDKILIEKVNAILKKVTKISEVERVVGVAPTINTSQKIDKEFLPSLSIVVLSRIGQIDSFEKADVVVFWYLSVDTDNPILVGVAWVKGEKKIFYGALYPRG